jgi:fructokinase
MSGERPCLFGEVLFDHFPDGARVLGGAPFNVAWHLQAFGRRPRFVSRVGDDAEGREIRAAMQDWGMDTGDLETDPLLPTGRVEVTLEGGEPSYDIVHPCAYDAVAAMQAPACGILYHGSLALREPVSRRALERLLEAGPGLVFVDVNLRPPWSTAMPFDALLERADWVKLNHHELAEVSAGATVDPDAFVERHGLAGLILTLGAGGAELHTRGGGHYAAAPQAGTAVIDTVGAGDAFAAVTILGISLGWDPQSLLERAQAFASRIVGMRGATPASKDFYQPFLDAWGLAGRA